MTTAQAAAALGMSDRHVRELVKRQELAAIRDETPRGPVLWFERAEVERFREARAKAAENPPAKRGRGRPPRVPKKNEAD